jgi:putative membrane protein
MNLNRISKRILIFSAMTVLAGATAIAQMQPGGGAGQQPVPPSQQPGQPGQPMPGRTGIGGMTANNAASPTDQAFVQTVMESDAAEVQLGNLAQEKSQSDDVKQFGKKMAENRKRLDDQLKPIADKLAISEPKQPSKKDRQTIAKLQSLSGPQFDEEYIKAVVKDHRKDVKEFKDASQSVQDPNLQQAAKQDTNVIAAHLQAIEQIAQTHNVAVDDKK